MKTNHILILALVTGAIALAYFWWTGNSSTITEELTPQEQQMRQQDAEVLNFIEQRNEEARREMEEQIKKRDAQE